MPITYPTDFKVKTIRRYEKGESIRSLSEELHISQSTLYQWRKEYCSIETPNRTYTPKEFDAISRRLRKLVSTPIRNCKKTPKKFCNFSAGGNKIKRFLAEKEC